MDKKKKELTDYHSAFVGSMGILLWPYRESTKISEEVVLRKQGIRLDALVDWEGEIPENLPSIFRIFRKKNIIEYKRADSDLSENVLAKALGYGNLYKALETSSDRRGFEDITVTIYRHAHPRKLFRQLAKRGL